MNPEYISAGIVHTVSERLYAYFLTPLTNILIVFVLIIMIVNGYMFKKLRKIKTKDYMTVVNMITLGVYFVFSVITSVLVSRLGPHGTLAVDDCDKTYMFVPRTLFIVVAIVNVVYCIIDVVTKIKKDREYKETEERGYYTERQEANDEQEDYLKRHEMKASGIDLNSFAENIKSKIDIDKVKNKVNEFTENVKDMINKKQG